MIAPQEEAGVCGYKMKPNIAKRAGGLTGGAEPAGKNHSLDKHQCGKQLGVRTCTVCVCKNFLAWSIKEAKLGNARKRICCVQNPSQ